MSSILKVDTIQDQNGNNIINENANTITIGASGDTISIPAGATLTGAGAGLVWQSVQTTGFTAVKGNAYPCNTTSAGFTVTLPATPSAGDQIQVVDYAGTFATNKITINPNGNKIEGSTFNFQLTGEREGVIITYIDLTQGWIATSGINEGTDALSPVTYSASYLIVAGGASGAGLVGGGGGAGGLLTGTTTITTGTVYTVTVGAGGASITGGSNGNNGSNSSFTGITTAVGGGGGGVNDTDGVSGGSGGGGANRNGGTPIRVGGAGTSGQGNAGGSGNNGSAPTFGAGGGGGGAGAVGGTATAGNSNVAGNGGAGTSSSITGSSVGYAGGGGGFSRGSPGGSATDGGGAGAPGSNQSGSNGTANTGGGGGGGGGDGGGVSGAGGSGVVILSVPTANYSATSTGSPTITTSGSNTILQFNGSGSYTG
jgi:hypothetical protein